MFPHQDLFVGPKLKVGRSKQHIADLNSAIGDFLDKHPYRIVIERHQDPGQHAWTIRVRGSMPLDFPLLLGDAVHNLRAALDLLACDLVRLNEGDTTKVYWPFSETASGFEMAITKRHVDRASPDVVDIVRSLQSYKGGNDALWGIHDLDITDKHKLLIPVATMAGITDVRLMQGPGVVHMSGIYVTPVHDGSIVALLPAASNIKVGDEFEAAFKITFGKGQPFARQSVVEILYQLVQTVERIIQRFEVHFVGQQVSPE
jgi:hypothetical protein